MLLINKKKVLKEFTKNDYKESGIDIKVISITNIRENGTPTTQWNLKYKDLETKEIHSNVQSSNHTIEDLLIINELK